MPTVFENNTPQMSGGEEPQTRLSGGTDFQPKPTLDAIFGSVALNIKVMFQGAYPYRSEG